MFRLLSSTAAASAVLLQTAVAVTPVEKVISLLQDLKGEVEAEGASEATAYNEFSCFCRDTTKSKSDSILAGRDSIDSLSAEIAAKTASKEAMIAELMKRKATQEQLSKDLSDTKVQFAKEKAEYEAEALELQKGIDSLNSAIKSIKSSKPGADSLIQLRETVKSSLLLAEAFGIKVAPQLLSSAKVFMQVDPTDPAYKFHSQGILDTLSKLLEEFTSDKQVLDSEWATAKATFESTIAGLEQKMKENKEAMDLLEANIETTKGEIAAARESLVTAEAVLQDDKLYMTDLTARCEERAKDWDQRSQLRSDELKALAGALEILGSNVSHLDEEVNERALLQQGSKPELKTISKHETAMSFLQEALSSARTNHAALRGGATSETSVRKDKALSMLKKEGQRLSSAMLSAMGDSLVADPFLKVKNLIQALVERLLAESTAEATKQGFCNTQLSKAEEARDFRMADTKKLDVEIQGLETKLQELGAEMEMLTGAIEKLNDDLKEATEQRDVEHDENLETIKLSKEGYEAVVQALKILKVFYKQAAKATVLAQVKASPVDEDTAGAGFKGAYTGSQEKSKGIIGLLEVIKSDFERTDRTTEAAEKKAHASFVEFDRTSKSDISGKETKKALDTEDAKTAAANLAQKTEDLKTAQGLLDSALKTIEDLKPTCIDFGMSYEERVAKREEEIAALKSALCILDAEGVEPGCPGGSSL
mmetsp:Transcript_42730/g.91669  ORF Transcript_42730/g.91669 Transcript_42730/m.91669 type:complete len:709 (-) Transcript_42730:102-2228(-)